MDELETDHAGRADNSAAYHSAARLRDLTCAVHVPVLFPPHSRGVPGLDQRFQPGSIDRHPNWQDNRRADAHRICLQQIPALFGGTVESRPALSDARLLYRAPAREIGAAAAGNCATAMSSQPELPARLLRDGHVQIGAQIWSRWAGTDPDNSTRTVVIAGGLLFRLALACTTAVIYEWTDADDAVGTEGVDGVYGRPRASRGGTPCGARADQLHVDAFCALPGSRQREVGGHHRAPGGAAGKLQAFGERLTGRVRQRRQTDGDDRGHQPQTDRAGIDHDMINGLTRGRARQADRYADIRDVDGGRRKAAGAAVDDQGLDVWRARRRD